MVVPPRRGRDQHRATGRQEVVHGLLEDVLAAVTEDDPLLIDAVDGRQPCRELAVVPALEGAAVVEEQLTFRLPQHLHAGRGGTVAVLITVEIDLGWRGH
jgi:hypothetical protein